ncbi:unnamed protein product [Caenorhabditis auriculariae]|uniref:Uncharacterized protein n=1 Tax=Caenorhabditis auriculariae TaxID=2777116 RepID=A0A8S1HXQ7_9PELO|nr:unnamed protein product [Caenorhabditis auriculariae]
MRLDSSCLAFLIAVFFVVAESNPGVRDWRHTSHKQRSYSDSSDESCWSEWVDKEGAACTYDCGGCGEIEQRGKRAEVTPLRGDGETTPFMAANGTPVTQFGLLLLTEWADKSADSKSAVQIERQYAMRRRVYAPCMQTPLSFAPSPLVTLFAFFFVVSSHSSESCWSEWADKEGETCSDYCGGCVIHDIGPSIEQVADALRPELRGLRLEEVREVGF